MTTVDDAPTVSVIVAAYYSTDTLAACLHAIQQQSYHDFEIVVVNSSPEQETAALMAAQFPAVRFHQHPIRLYPHAARNEGIALARGSLLVFTDADCMPEPTWLAALVAAHEARGAPVGGAMDVMSATWAEDVVHLVKYGWALPGLPRRSSRYLPTANVLYARAMFDVLGLFDGDIMLGDAPQGMRARAAGLGGVFAPDAVVRHVHGVSLGALVRQRYGRGYGFAPVRATFYNWPCWYRWGYTLTFWLQPLLMLVRGALDASRAGWGWRFVAALPGVYLGHLAFAVGEAMWLLQNRCRGVTAAKQQQWQAPAPQ